MTNSFSKPMFFLIIVIMAFFALLPMMRNIPEINIPSKPYIHAYPEDTTLEMDIRTSTQEHANMRHGMEADMARECSGRPEQRFFNPITKRTAFMCHVEGFFGFHILSESGDEVTAFLKNKMKNFNQVLKYMENAGYQLLH